MKKLLPLCAAIICFNGAAMAENSPFTGNVAFTTDYIFRGISQSNEEPTIQGGMDWNDASTGLYAGIWGSGVDFTDATTEIDAYAGMKGTMMDDINWNLGAIYYFYPGADEARNYDFWELAASVGYDFGFMQTTASLNYSPDFFGSSGDAWYPALNATIPLNNGFTANAGLAHQWVEDNTAYTIQDYTTWSLGLGYDYEGFNFGLKYHDTDLTEPTECADGCGARIVFTISRTF